MEIKNSEMEIELSADLAETNPENDCLGYAPLAESIAKGISKMIPVEGITIAIAGDWGSGKTTVINFVREYLKGLDTDFEVIEFNPWWFSDDESLVKNLLAEIAKRVKPNSKKERELAGSLLELASVVDEAPIELKPSIMGISVDLKKLAKLSAEKLKSSKSVPDVKEEIASLLRELGIRFLVIIDDVDRLSVDEVRALFRGIKAVADLPNVVYLLAIDRDVVANSLDGAFPGRGKAYLEKIIQVAFDLPTPSSEGIAKIFLHLLNKILEHSKVAKFNNERFWSLYKMGLQFMLVTPRDAVRLANALCITIPPICEEVSLPDFIALECLRLNMEEVYKCIQGNKDLFSGHINTYRSGNDRERDELRDFHNGWIESIRESQQKWLKELLSEIFPKLQYAWGNTSYGSDHLPEWRRELRPCAPDLFEVYFRFSVPTESVSVQAINSFKQLLVRKDAHDFLVEILKSDSAERKNQLWKLIERFRDHVDDLSADTASYAFSVFVDAWDEYKDVPGVKEHYLVPNEWSLLGLLFQFLKRVEINNRKKLIETSIVRNKNPVLVLKVLSAIGREHGKFGNGSERTNNPTVSEDEFNELSNSFLLEIQSNVDGEKITDSGTLCRFVYFVKEVNEGRLSLLINRMQATSHGLVALMSYGCEETIDIFPPRDGGKSHRFSVNLEKVSTLIPLEKLEERFEIVERSDSLNERANEIFECFKDALARKKEADAKLAEGSVGREKGEAGVDE